MGTRILVGHEQGSDDDAACLFDSVTETAFGPVFYARKGFSAEWVAEQFLDWHLKKYGDPRAAVGKELVEREDEFIKERCLTE